MKGKGAHVWDVQGSKYLDVNSGQFCSVFGHSDRKFAKLLKKIGKTLQDTDTGTLSKQVLDATYKIKEIIPNMNPRTILLSTGAEANECCLKYAKFLKKKSGVVSFSQGYHGLTHGTAAYSMSRKRIRPEIDFSYDVPCPIWYKEEPMDKSELQIYIDLFQKTCEQNFENIAVAIFEVLVSGGGFLLPPPEYFQEIRKICDHYGIFLVFDECQTGIGRTGSWFMYEKIGVIPDFITTGKALGSGLPVSAVIANGNKIMDEKFEMEYFSSHQNEPFAGEIVNFVINRIIDEKLLERNVFSGYELSQILQSLHRQELLENPRGIGLMQGFDLINSESSESRNDSQFLIELGIKNGILLQTCNYGRTVRLLPNYLITKSNFDELDTKLGKTLKDYRETTATSR